MDDEVAGEPDHVGVHCLVLEQRGHKHQGEVLRGHAVLMAVQLHPASKTNGHTRLSFHTLS